MKVYLLPSAVAVCIAASLQAQAVEIKVNHGQSLSAAAGLSQQHSFKAIKTVTFNKGQTKTKALQYFNGVLVYGHHLVVSNDDIQHPTALKTPTYDEYHRSRANWLA